MAADEIADISKGGEGGDVVYGYNGNNNEQPSMISAQENEAL